MMATEFKRYGKIYLMRLRAHMMMRATSPLNFFIMVVSSILEGVLAVFFVRIIYNFADTISGWNFYQAMIVVASFQIIEALIWVSTANFAGLRNPIRTGNFDIFLIRPLNNFFSMATWRVDPEDFGRLITAMSILWLSVKNLDLSLGNILLNLPGYIGAIICGFFIMAALSLLVNCTFFWFIEANSINIMLGSLIKASQYPTDILYGRVAKVITSTIFPLTFLGTVPAKIFLNGFSWGLISGSLMAAIISVLIALYVYKSGLKVYSSASS